MNEQKTGGGHSLYCTLLYIAGDGKIKSVHRKLQPTYEERLTWSPGDGNGIIKSAPSTLADGGSCIAGPDGEWIIPPVVGKEDLIIGVIDFNKVLEERHNFDPAGHYSRPDVTKLTVNRTRQTIIETAGDSEHLL